MDPDVQGLWRAEESFWLDGPAFYERWMMADALMVFPEPVGIVEGNDILAGLRHGPRWGSVDIRERSHTRAGDTVVLAYRAIGTREGSEPYIALCSSTYIRDADNWKLLSHQQTPAG